MRTRSSDTTNDVAAVLPGGQERKFPRPRTPYSAVRSRTRFAEAALPGRSIPSRFFHAITADDGWLRRGRHARAHAYRARTGQTETPSYGRSAFICVGPYVRDGFGSCDGGGSVRESSGQNRRGTVDAPTRGRTCINSLRLLFYLFIFVFIYFIFFFYRCYYQLVPT